MGYNGRYILVADDDKDDQYILQSAFNERGFTEKLVFVNDGDELLAHLNAPAQKMADLPKLILLDLNMPKKTGKEALVEIKRDGNLKTIPVIIFSTTSDEGQISQCYELGANSYIVKPGHYQSLMDAVDIIHAYWFKTVRIAS
jgi:two-component system response regulator